MSVPGVSCAERSVLKGVKLSAAAWALVAANVVPVAGVLFLGWSLGTLLLLYWAESAIVGFYNVLKMLSLRRWSNLFQVPFFCVHYGGFMAGHLVFVVALLLPMSGTDVRTAAGEAWPAALGLVASHGYSFYANFWVGGERATATPDQLFLEPYGRIVVMHLTIIFGAFVAFAIGSPVGFLVLLVVLKTAVDLHAHLRQRKKFRGPPAQTVV